MRRTAETRWFSLSKRDLTVLIVAVCIALISVAALKAVSQLWGSDDIVFSSGELVLIPDRLDVNNATEYELTLLPGIGPRTAEAIVQERQERGPFRSLEDMQRVSGIGPRTVEAIRPHAMCAPPD